MAVQPFPLELKHLYTSAEFIGSGGFARVFKARRKDSKVVAVKIPLNLDEATGRSFIREITSWQRLAHRNIVSLFDANILPIPYLELEYVEGGNLEDLRKPLEVANACEIVFDIAEGLKYAHRQGIVHRDLKPHNILLTKERIPKITDWGLSRVIAESKSSSQYSFSPVYAAPEQVSPKKFGKPDERTDIYQLGVIFYNLLTNELPFKGEDLIEIATAIAMEEPVPPSSLNPEAKKVEHIVLRCIAKRKEDRYQNVGELQKELAEFIKRDYKESLKLSLGAGDMKRSAFYCAELCLVHARLGDVKEALKFALDLKNYAGSEAKKDVDVLVEELRFRMEKGLGINEDLFSKMEVVLHQVKMGWGKQRKKSEQEAFEKLRREQEEEERRKREEERLKKESEEQERLSRLRDEEEKARREREEQERLRREEEEQRERTEVERREREEQDKLCRQKEQEERIQKERKAREEVERREKERQKEREEEERLRRQREEQERIARVKHPPVRVEEEDIFGVERKIAAHERASLKEYELRREKEELAGKERGGSSWKGFLAVALVLGALLLGIWVLALGTTNAPESSKITPTPTPKVTPSTTPIPSPAPNQKTFTNSISMEFALIPAGKFDMGSPQNETGRWDNEGPIHQVKISNAFYMGKYEVTQKQWQEVMGNNPSYFTGDNLPVEGISWDDVQEFIKKLNEKEGTNMYRLPSEAEWEYAARAGNKTRYSYGDDESKLGDYAWYDANSGGKTHEVGQKMPNPWGLYDMHGNVWEWVQDIYHNNYYGAPIDGSSWEGDGSLRVARGGSLGVYAGFSRSASRAYDASGYRGSPDPGARGGALGFRLVRDM